VRWHYAQGEWQQFVTQERARTIRVSWRFLLVLLAFAASLALFSALLGDPLIGDSIPILLLLAGVFLLGLVSALAGRSAFARRQRLAGDAYISQLGVVRPDGYHPLHSAGYHLTAVVLQPGAPSRLRFLLRAGRVARVLGFLGNAPGQLEVVVPVPYGHDEDATVVAAQLSITTA
jgi:hypothetical protein